MEVKKLKKDIASLKDIISLKKKIASLKREIDILKKKIELEELIKELEDSDYDGTDYYDDDCIESYIERLINSLDSDSDGKEYCLGSLHAIFLYIDDNELLGYSEYLIKSIKHDKNFIKYTNALGLTSALKIYTLISHIRIIKIDI